MRAGPQAVPDSDAAEQLALLGVEFLIGQRAGIAQPLEYQMKLWLGMGITTVRDVSSETPKTIQLRARSLSGDLIGPRLYVYARYAYMPVPRNEVEARQRVRDLKAQGADGLKLFGMDKDVYPAVLDEAKKLGLKTAHHMAVDETNAWDAAAGGLTSIEHWYGIPDAALGQASDLLRALYR